MKYLKITLLLLSLIFLSCDNESLVAPINLTATNVSEISGKLVDWDKGIGKSAYFLNGNNISFIENNFGVSQIDFNGNFSFENLDKPEPSDFHRSVLPQLDNTYDILENSLACTDSSAKLVLGSIFIIEDSTLNFKGFIISKNFPYNTNLYNGLHKSGNFFVEYIYVEKNVELTGSINYKNSFLKFTANNKYNYNLKLQKGWNKKVTHILSYNYQSKNDTVNIYGEYKVDNFEPISSKWYYSFY